MALFGMLTACYLRLVAYILEDEEDHIHIEHQLSISIRRGLLQLRSGVIASVLRYYGSLEQILQIL